MGSALPKGGPAGLFLGFVIWAGVMWAVNECFAEMVSYLPVPSPFIRFGSEWVDGALGFAMAWNFFLNMVRDKKGTPNDVETRANFAWSLYRPSWYLLRLLVSLEKRERFK